MKFFKIKFTEFFICIVAIANASPRANCDVVLEVGTIPPASITFGIKSLISDALYNIESFLETIPIRSILFLFAN